MTSEKEKDKKKKGKNFLGKRRHRHRTQRPRIEKKHGAFRFRSLGSVPWPMCGENKKSGRK